MDVFMVKGTMCIGFACNIVPFSINSPNKGTPSEVASYMKMLGTCYRSRRSIIWLGAWLYKRRTKRLGDRETRRAARRVQVINQTLATVAKSLGNSLHISLLPRKNQVQTHQSAIFPIGCEMYIWKSTLEFA